MTEKASSKMTIVACNLRSNSSLYTFLFKSSFQTLWGNTWIWKYLSLPAWFNAVNAQTSFLFFSSTLTNKSNRCYMFLMLGKYLRRAQGSLPYGLTQVLVSCRLLPPPPASAETWPHVSGWINGFVSSENNNLKCMLQTQAAAKLSAVNWISHMLLCEMDGSIY